MDHVLADHRATDLAATISTATDDAVWCVEFLAIGDRVGITAIAVVMMKTSLNFGWSAIDQSPRSTNPVCTSESSGLKLIGQDRKAAQPLVSSAVHLAYADIFRSAQPIARNIVTINRRAPLTA
jgi:hypothetical protein